MATPYAPEETAGPSEMSELTQWLLVAVLVLATLVVPALVLLVNVGEGLPVFGLPWLDTLVALPMVPAVLFAAVGVWSAVRD